MKSFDEFLKKDLKLSSEELAEIKQAGCLKLLSQYIEFCNSSDIKHDSEKDIQQYILENFKI